MQVTLNLPQPPKTSLHAIPDGPQGVYVTLRMMRQLAREGKVDPPIRELALSIVKPNGQKDWIGEARALHEYVRDQIRYVRDINGVETLQTPEQTIRIGQGDCDDKSTLLAALLESIGHPTRFVAVGFRPGKYSHVLLETKIGGKWIAAETTEPVSLGWYPPRTRARMVIHN